MFVNFSNHPIENWSDEQKKEAIKLYGEELIDIPFPRVSAEINEEDIERLADTEVGKIMRYKPDVVMCQGEFTLAFAVIGRLKEKGVKCVAACSERRVREYTDENGNYKKELGFEFVRFREYL